MAIIIIIIIIIIGDTCNYIGSLYSKKGILLLLVLCCVYLASPWRQNKTVKRLSYNYILSYCTCTLMFVLYLVVLIVLKFLYCMLLYF